MKILKTDRNDMGKEKFMEQFGITDEPETISDGDLEGKEVIIICQALSTS